eukprot:gene713-648_t
MKRAFSGFGRKSKAAPKSKYSRSATNLSRSTDTIKKNEGPKLEELELQQEEMLPNQDEVHEQGKFVIPEHEDERPIIFVSHQWTSYNHPDPNNQQFNVLKGALKLLLDESTVSRPIETNIGAPGMPRKKKFASVLKNSLVWLDYMSVPQLRARHRRSAEGSGVASVSSDQSAPDRLTSMLSAINSVPAYLQRSSIMIVLAPVVSHADESHVDCQFSSWRQRGWCRLEAILASLMGSQCMLMLLVESPTKISLFSAYDMLDAKSVGDGDFSCCARNHVVEVGNHKLTIPCDKVKIAKVFLNQYRWLLAHEAIVLRNLPEIEHRRQLKTWDGFATAFKFDFGKPLQPSCGSLHPPIIYAAMSNNLEVLKHVISCKADVNHPMVADGKYTGYTPLHLVMRNSFGDTGMAMVDLLLDYSADPYRCSRGLGFTSKGFRDPLSLGISNGNVEMVTHYCHKVKPKFAQLSDQFGGTNELYAITKGIFEIVQRFIEHGAEFKSRNAFGMGTLALFSPKDFQETDLRVLDILYEAGKLGDLNAQNDNLYGYSPSVPKLVYYSLWNLRNRGYLKQFGLAGLIFAVGGGTALHCAVFRDKPDVISWLLKHKVNPNIKNKAGVTPLQLAMELQHARGVGELSYGHRSSTILMDAVDLD